MKNFLKFILIVFSLTVAVVLFGTEVQIVPDIPITSVTETSPEPSKKFQELISPNSSTQIESSPSLLQRLPEPAKLIQPGNPIYQNYEVDREGQELIASKYGHFRYPQGNVNKMVIISSYGAREYQRFEYLHPEAARELMDMIYTARDEGIWLVPVSGFRTFERQQKLFKAQIQRHGSVKGAAKVSAPPGYSEHHTGFAIDLTDGNFPKKDLTIDFENTDAYKWLTDHAVEFGFELSFPRNNPQRVSYEPWHWRYIGSPEATAAFAQARKF